MQLKTNAALDIALLRPSPSNPRGTIEPGALASMRDSLETSGQLQSILVRRTTGEHYEIIAGHTRVAAARELGWTHIAAIIAGDQVDDAGAAAMAIAENVVRSALTPSEQAAAIEALGGKIDDAELARRLGLSPGKLARRRNLTALIPEWRKAMAPGGEHAEARAGALEIIALQPEGVQRAAAQHFSTRGPAWKVHPVLTVASARSFLADHSRRMDLMPWGADDAELLPAAGACSRCSKRSDCVPSLFAELEIAPKGRSKKAAGNGAVAALCLDSDCWDKKHAAHASAQIAAQRAEHGDALVLLDGTSRDFDRRRRGIVKQIPDSVRHAALSPWDWERAKKGAKGAQPAYDLHSGRLLHVKVYRSRTTTGNRGKGAKAKVAKTETPAAILNAKLERLKARRLAWIVDYVRTRLESATLADALGPAAEVADLLPLIAEFGVTPLSSGSRRLSMAAARPRALNTAEREVLGDIVPDEWLLPSIRCWWSVRDKLSGLLMRRGAAQPDELMLARRMAAHLWTLTSADLDTLAAAEIPESAALVRARGAASTKPARKKKTRTSAEGRREWAAENKRKRSAAARDGGATARDAAAAGTTLEELPHVTPE